MNKPEIRIEFVEMKVIYVRFKGPYIEFRKQSRSLFNKLFAFAKKNNLITEGVTKVLTLYNDNPFITNENNLRTSVCMTIPKNAVFDEVDGISSMNIRGNFGIGRFELSRNEYTQAWEYMYQNWLFENKLKPRDSAPFELYVNEPPKNSKDKSISEIYIPIE